MEFGGDFSSLFPSSRSSLLLFTISAQINYLHARLLLGRLMLGGSLSGLVCYALFEGKLSFCLLWPHDPNGSCCVLRELVPSAIVVGQRLDLGHQVGQAECLCKFSLPGASEKNSLKARLGTTLNTAGLSKLTFAKAAMSVYTSSGRMPLTLPPFSKYIECTY